MSDENQPRAKETGLEEETANRIRNAVDLARRLLAEGQTELGLPIAERLIEIPTVRQEALAIMQGFLQTLERTLHLDTERARQLLLQFRQALAERQYPHALAIAQSLAQQHPCWSNALNEIGHSLVEREFFDQGRRFLYWAAAVDPKNVVLNLRIGWSFCAQGNTNPALSWFHLVEDLAAGTTSDEERAHIFIACATALQAGDSAAEALRYAEAATRLADLTEGYRLTGECLQALNRPEEALQSFRRLFQAEPPKGGCKIVELLSALGRFDEARAMLDSLMAGTMPDQEDVSVMLHRIFSQGQDAFALELSGKLIEKRLVNASNHSFNIWLADRTHGTSVQSQQRARKEWNDRHVKPLNLVIAPHNNSRDPNRPLRIGAVSGEFRDHSTALGWSGFWKHRDRKNFQLYCYSTNNVPNDSVTADIIANADSWREIAHLDDDTVAAIIRADQIDILIDISGHSWKTHRLLMFARKPAPVQVTAWGYAHGVGVSGVDYFFSDRIQVPENERQYYSEQIFYLPVMIGYACPVVAPAVTELPARTRGYVTFASLNGFEKFDDNVFQAWAEILHAVPGSKLQFKYGNLLGTPREQIIRKAFADRGIAEDRVLIAGQTPWFDHLKMYGEVDIALDPFPHGGGITTCDSLWMGVPVVTLLGDSIAGRNGASLVTCVGHPELITHSLQEYKDRAIALASDLDTLAAMRRTLRSKVMASPLSPANYAQVVQNALGTIWRDWCANGTTFATDHPQAQ